MRGRERSRALSEPVLPPFTETYPEIVLEVVIDPGLTYIVAQRFDAGIRHGESLDKDVVAVAVSGPQRMAVVGAPQYFASDPPPATPHDLRMHRCINFRLPSPAPGTLYKWEFEKVHHSIEVEVEGPLIFDDEGMVVDTALAGVGLGCVIDEQVASLLQAGELVRVLEDWCPPFPGFFLYYPGRHEVSPALAAFVDAVRVPAKRRRGR